MASSNPGDDDFTHHIAIQLSRALNLVNPNDLLARRVQDIAKTNTLEGFAAGMLIRTLLKKECSNALYSGQIIRQVQGFLLS